MQDFNLMSNWGDAAKKLLGDDFWNSISSQLHPESNAGHATGNVASGFLPIDVIESQNEFFVFVDLPGISSTQNVNVYVEGDTLYIKGEASPKLPQGELRLSERRRGTFERSFSLSAPVNKDAVRARYEYGVLEIKLPKLKQKASRTRVPIDF